MACNNGNWAWLLDNDETWKNNEKQYINCEFKREKMNLKSLAKSRKITWKTQQHDGFRIKKLVTEELHRSYNA